VESSPRSDRRDDKGKADADDEGKKFWVGVGQARAGGKEIFLAGEKRERKICERSELRAPKALHNENEEEEEECSLAIMM
jgi:hypothetical protein